MTRAEKAIRNEQMRQYKAEGHSMGEVAEKFGVTKNLAQSICKGICPQSMRRCKNYRNQFTSGDYDRIANCKKIVESANQDFEYIGGFSSVDGIVQIRCRKCNHEFERSLITLRHHSRNHRCPNCENIERERLKAIKREQAEYKKQREQEQKKFKKDCHQNKMKECPICGELFLRRGKYCSQKCADQNHWMMKDGYRYRFPLKELFERDNGICYICGGECSWEDKKTVNGIVIYGNYYPSRDHVIPKSKGGENSWDNLRLAHRICNSLKHDSPLSLKNA